MKICPNCGIQLNDEMAFCTNCGAAESGSTTPTKPGKPVWIRFWNWINGKWETKACTHNYIPEVTPASCTTGGYTTHTCNDCDIRYRDSFTKATGHRFVNGICSVCGEQESTSPDPLKPARPSVIRFHPIFIERD